MNRQRRRSGAPAATDGALKHFRVATLSVLAGLVVCWSLATISVVHVSGVSSAAVQDPTVQFKGRVIDSASGTGVLGATVVVQRLGGQDQQPRRVVETDAGGHFSVSDVSPGSYQITATHGDYSAGGYGQLWPGSALHQLRLRSGKAPDDITVRLWKPATVEGALVTEEGKPLAGATLMLLSRTAVPRLRAQVSPMQTATDDRGVYRFSAVSPGKYVLGTIQSYMTICDAGAQQRCSVSPRSQSLRVTRDQFGRLHVFESVFYPSASELSDAQVLWLHPGEHANGFDLTVPAVDAVEVRGTVDSTLGRLAGIAVSAIRPGNIGLDTIELGAAVTSTDSAGRFVLLGVPPGVHTISAEYRPAIVQPLTSKNTPYGVVQSGSITVLPVSAERPLLVAQSNLIVGTEDVPSWDLTLAPAPALKGIVKFDGDSPPPSPTLLQSHSATVRAAGQNNPFASVRLSESGEFEFPSLPPRAYWLSIDRVPGWYLRSIVVDGKPASDTPIDLGIRSPSSVEVHLIDGASFIDGIVTRNGESDPNATVFVFPPAALSGTGTDLLDDIRLINPNERGEFSAGPLQPGDYFVIAIHDAWFDLDWREPEILQALSKRAELVRLREREHHLLTVTCR